MTNTQVDAERKAKETTLCPEVVMGRGGWPSSHVCGRKVFADNLCKMHFNAKVKRAERDAEWKAERAELARMRDILKRLLPAEANATLYYSAAANKTITSKVVVDLGWLLNIAATGEAE